MTDLRFSGVTVTFGGLTALDDVSLTLGAHQVHGVIGPNGAGKSTLFNVACGLVKPDSGEVVRRGKRIPRLRPRDLPRVGMARTLQALVLDENVSVLRNVMLGADHQPRPGVLGSLLTRPHAGPDEHQQRQQARRVLDELGIGAHADDLPSGLSLAARKRVDLARALVTDPDLLLLDEPASGLSATEKHELGRILRTLTRKMSVLLVEHDMDMVMRVCDEITVLDHGSVIAQGPPDDIRRDPAALAVYLGKDAD